MLILKVRRGERIRIGDGITVEVTEVIRGRVARIGVTCDRQVPVWRHELYERMHPKDAPAKEEGG